MNLEPCRTFKAKIIKFMLLNIIHWVERLQRRVWNGGWLFSKCPLLLNGGQAPNWNSPCAFVKRFSKVLLKGNCLSAPWCFWKLLLLYEPICRSSPSEPPRQRAIGRAAPWLNISDLKQRQELPWRAAAHASGLMSLAGKRQLCSTCGQLPEDCSRATFGRGCLAIKTRTSF